MPKIGKPLKIMRDMLRFSYRFLPVFFILGCINNSPVDNSPEQKRLIIMHDEDTIENIKFTGIIKITTENAIHEKVTVSSDTTREITLILSEHEKPIIEVVGSQE